MTTALLTILVFAVLAGAAVLVHRKLHGDDGARAGSAPRKDALPVISSEPDSPAVAVATAVSAAVARENPGAQEAQHASDDGVQEVGADFYAEVVGLLEAELARSPQRDDLRIKLLEVYAATERKVEFVKLAAVHLKAVKDGRSDPNWIQVQEMGRRLVPGHALFSESAGTAPTPAPRDTTPRLRRYYESVDAQQLGVLQTELHKAYQGLRQDIKFWKKLRELCAEFIGAPAPLVHAVKLSSFVGGAQIYVKNEALRPARDAVTLSAVGQVLLAQTLGRWRVIASPADDGHVVAVTRAAIKLGLEAHIVVTESDKAARADEIANVLELGAKLTTIPDGSGGASEGQRGALTEALQHGAGTLFISPLAAGPSPYPMIVRELQGLSGLELKSQVNALLERQPNGIIVSASDGMPAIGTLQAFLGATAVKLFCVEAAAGSGSRHHRLGREHGWLRASGRVRYSSVPGEVARFAAQHLMPDGAYELQLAGGEVLVETFTISRYFTPKQSLIVVLPAEPAVTA